MNLGELDMRDNYVKLTEIPVFWTLSITSMEWLMYEAKRESLDLDDINYTEVDNECDKCLDLQKNKDAYINIMNDTTSAMYRLQFVVIRSRNHCRRKILALIKDLVKRQIMIYLGNIKNQPAMMDDISDEFQLAEQYRLEYVINDIYKKLLDELQIKESKHSEDIRNLILVYILYTIIEVFKSFGDELFAKCMEGYRLNM